MGDISLKGLSNNYSPISSLDQIQQEEGVARTILWALLWAPGHSFSLDINKIDVCDDGRQIYENFNICSLAEPHELRGKGIYKCEPIDAASNSNSNTTAIT